jgi:hypothetical protein
MMIADWVRTSALIAATLTASPAAAVQCTSVGGHINGKPVQITRQVVIKGDMMTLAGQMNGKPMPTRKLPCMKMETGYYCEVTAGPVYVTTVTNGNRLIETVNRSDTKAEQAGVSYQCTSAF